MKSIIEIKNLSKKYKLRDAQSYYSLRDTIVNLFKNPKLIFYQKRKEFWALRDFNLKVYPGEVIGIIGNNGAGKSTLLKILSRITPPSRGEVVLRGRVASLLEIGTGFHPELTGRENIYLNGTILGMSKKEIKDKFNEIVSFAEIHQFLDTPVKFYSSGMYMRLAFSVAAHLEPEILIVDEVLSVGDAAFQRKSLGKMKSVSKQGRTVLFVSHNMAAVASLCSKVVLLEKGKIAAVGEPRKVITSYLKFGTNLANSSEYTVEYSNKAARITKVRIISDKGTNQRSFDIRKPIGIEVSYEIFDKDVLFTTNIQLKNESDLIIFNSPQYNILDSDASVRSNGFYRSICWIPGNFLPDGIFSVRVSLTGFTSGKDQELVIDRAVNFKVVDSHKIDSVRGRSMAYFPGVVRPKLKWERFPVK